ncbi:Gfo/Idh/MocA family protein [Naasia lichenicola]|uniref:Gfo/Idh/MocA family oxidoreductase n=1 Tax=Naasia lichenicola TaxID=2565933 RepID=A0A4S4FMJ5_9MICO|nr:Gfo/Idh/MocA family oxidoreductase [Naasia lichenicola]THG31639.1 Gfo/Idh/MocA family oxidoreductase [Naasia lichenicola]
MTTTKSVVRWAIVGTGGIARRTLGDLRLTENAEVVAVCSRKQETADAFAAETGIGRAYGDFDALLGDDDVDALYIGIPHGKHFEYAQRALRAGKHVLCEKPLTMTADEARELQALARENGVFLMEAMWMKYTPSMRKALELVESGTIGEPRFVQAGLGYPVPADGPQRFWVAELGGGALFDMGVYTIALAHLFLGTPDSVRASGVMRADGVDLYESVILGYPSGAQAQLTTSITFWIPPAGSLGGTGGSISFGEPLFSPATLRVAYGTPPTPPTVENLEFEKEGAGYVPMFRAAGEAILRGELEEPLHPMSVTIEVLEIMERVRDELILQRDAR